MSSCRFSQLLIFWDLGFKRNLPTSFPSNCLYSALLLNYLSPPTHFPQYNIISAYLMMSTLKNWQRREETRDCKKRENRALLSVSILFLDLFFKYDFITSLCPTEFQCHSWSSCPVHTGPGQLTEGRKGCCLYWLPGERKHGTRLKLFNSRFIINFAQ